MKQLDHTSSVLPSNKPVIHKSKKSKFNDVSASDDIANSESSDSPRLFSNVWIVSESDRTCNYLQTQLTELGMQCTAQFTAKTLDHKMSSIITKMHAERPDFIWITSLHHDALHPINKSMQVAARLIVTEQQRLGGQYLLENVNVKDEDRGVYISDAWQASNHLGTLRPLWWCGLGMAKPKQLYKGQFDDCSNVTVFTTLSIPMAISNCCKNAKFTGRSIMPSRFPKAYYSAVSAMIKHVSLIPSVPENIYKTARKGKPKPPQPTPDETPGDHADTEGLVKHGTHEGFEETYDDCGDDVSTIAEDHPNSTSYQCFNCDSDEDEPWDEHHSWVFATMELANRALGHNQVYSGQHDVCVRFSVATLALPAYASNEVSRLDTHST